MKILAIIGAIIIGATLLFVFIANKTPADTSDAAKLSIETIQSDTKAGAQLLDVRTPEEFNAGFIEGATNLPLASLQTGQLPAGVKDKTMYLYCRSGSRAEQAKRILEKAGYTNVINLGGMSDVVELGGTQIK